MVIIVLLLYVRVILLFSGVWQGYFIILPIHKYPDLGLDMFHE